jgi:hypothetical protein
MEMEDRIQYLRSYPRIKIESICFKLVASVLLIAYAILSILSSPLCAATIVSYFLNDKKHFSVLVVDDFGHFQHFYALSVVCMKLKES